MAIASFAQSNFQGGEWSPFSQGRFDRPDYRTGLARDLNFIPLEEGALTRRPGFRWLATTRLGAAAVLREFHFDRSAPYSLELTQGHIRMFAGSNLVGTNDPQHIVTISGASPALVTTAGETDWETGTEIAFQVNGDIDLDDLPLMAHLLNRTFIATVLSTSTFTLTDPVTNAPFNGSSITYTTGLSAVRVLDIETDYLASELQDIRTVQDNRSVLLLHAAHKPLNLNADTVPEDGEFATFTDGSQDFKDGPYFDPYDGAGTVVPGGTTGTVSLELEDSVYPFEETDVGRQMRLLSEPPEWDDEVTYALGESVRWQGLYYTALAETTGENPNVTPASWGVNIKAARWTWGIITTVTDNRHADIEIRGVDLLNTDAMHLWKMGLYSDTTGWPTSGVYHEGRFWITGNVIPNRIDGSKSNDTMNFATTDEFGQVADDNAVAAYLRATDVNAIYWMLVDDQGLVCGTQAGEWLIRATATGQKITPTNIQASRPTKYGSSDVNAISVGQSILFVGRFNRKLWQYSSEAAAAQAKYSAVNMTLRGKHLAATGIAEVVYQQELMPIVWARMLNGKIAGLAYQLDGEYANIKNSFAGWFDVERGDGYSFVSIQSGPDPNGTDTLMAVVRDPGGVHHVEQLTLIFGQNAQPLTASFLDHAVVPAVADVNPAETGVIYYGLDILEGKTVRAYVAGLDMGDHVVVDGKVEILYDDNFTPGLLLAQTLAGAATLGLGVVINTPFA